MKKKIELFSFIDICQMKQPVVFTNPTGKGNMHALLGNDLLVLRASGWEVHVNPMAQVGMKRFIVVDQHCWNSDLLKYEDGLK